MSYDEFMRSRTPDENGVLKYKGKQDLCSHVYPKHTVDVKVTNPDGTTTTVTKELSFRVRIMGVCDCIDGYRSDNDNNSTVAGVAQAFKEIRVPYFLNSPIKYSRGIACFCENFTWCSARLLENARELRAAERFFEGTYRLSSISPNFFINCPELRSVHKMLYNGANYHGETLPTAQDFKELPEELFAHNPKLENISYAFSGLQYMNVLYPNTFDACAESLTNVERAFSAPSTAGGVSIEFAQLPKFWLRSLFPNITTYRGCFFTKLGKFKSGIAADVGNAESEIWNAGW